MAEDFLGLGTTAETGSTSRTLGLTTTALSSAAAIGVVLSAAFDIAFGSALDVALIVALGAALGVTLGVALVVFLPTVVGPTLGTSTAFDADTQPPVLLDLMHTLDLMQSHANLSSPQKITILNFNSFLGVTQAKQKTTWPTIPTQPCGSSWMCRIFCAKNSAALPDITAKILTLGGRAEDIFLIQWQALHSPTLQVQLEAVLLTWLGRA